MCHIRSNQFLTSLASEYIVCTVHLKRNTDCNHFFQWSINRTHTILLNSVFPHTWLHSVSDSLYVNITKTVLTKEILLFAFLLYEVLIDTKCDGCDRQCCNSKLATYWRFSSEKDLHTLVAAQHRMISNTIQESMKQCHSCHDELFGIAIQLSKKCVFARQWLEEFIQLAMNQSQMTQTNFILWNLRFSQ